MKRFSKLISVALAVLMIMSAVAVMPASAATAKSAKPAKIKVANTTKGVKVSWSKTKGAKKYVVMRKLSSAKKFSVIKTVKTAKAGSYVDKKAKAGKKYAYAVTTNSSVAKPKQTKTIVRLKTPTNVTSKIVRSKEFGMTAVRVSWKKVDGAKRYDVYRARVSKDKVGKFYWAARTSGKETYSDDGMGEARETYVYKVVACNGSSKSAYSAASKPIKYLSDLSLIARMSPDYDGVALYITDPNGAKSFDIYRKAKGESKYTLIASPKVSELKVAAPYDIEFSDEYMKLIGAVMGAPKVDMDQFFGVSKTPMYIDNNVVEGTEYSYYVEVKVGTGKARCSTITTTYQKADYILKTGETIDLVKGSMSEDEYNGYLELISEQGLKMDISVDVADKTVATVDKNNILTAVAPGETDITVKSVMKTSILATEIQLVTVTVKARVRVE